MPASVYIMPFDKPGEECGIFGYFSDGDADVARMTYYGLYSLQHRGQESCGIAVNDSGTIIYHKDMGYVNEVFNDVVLSHLKGTMAIGHVRYSTTGGSTRENAQPLVIKYRKGQMALAHNGNLVNTIKLREEMEEQGLIFQSTIDSEVILNLISRSLIGCDDLPAAIMMVMDKIRGAYAFLLLTEDKLVAVRDPYGIRPLCLGILGSSHVVASESCALDSIGADFVRDIEPGEILVIDTSGMRSYRTSDKKRQKLCVFEHVYFARTDSIIDDIGVYQFRAESGKILAKQHPVEADLVIGVPDSGLDAAHGYSLQSGIPYGHGLVKNRYVGRTFIQPDQKQREKGVRIKLNAIKNNVIGKRIIMIDDSIVRGTTTKRIVQLLRDAGAREVHMRVSSPPIKYPCFYGIDTPSRKQLVAARKSVEDIRELIGADSLGYLSLDALNESAERAGGKCNFCMACFNGEYPMGIPDNVVDNENTEDITEV
jgi:amidophosphoribosyltransferase